MVEYLLDYRQVLDAGDDPHRPTAGWAGLDVDIEHALEPLRRGHSGPALYASSRVGEGANT